MRSKIFQHIYLSGLLLLSACSQTTPSMMNTAPVELSTQTHLENIPANKVDALSMSILADQYRRYGDGPMEITLTYDVKNFSSLKAMSILNKAEQLLAQNGLSGVTMDAMTIEGGMPNLMVTYPSVHANPPSDCGTMPGLRDNKTFREIGDYRFGCGVETMLAKQIYRPSDLRGVDGNVMGTDDGRRIVNVMQTYHTLNEQQASGALGETLERDALTAD